MEIRRGLRPPGRSAALRPIFEYRGLQSGRISPAEERLEDLRQEEGELFSLKSLRDAKIKADILNRDYQQITRDITRDSDSSQLMIGMELYLEGYVDERDFSDQ